MKQSYVQFNMLSKQTRDVPRFKISPKPKEQKNDKSIYLVNEKESSSHMKEEK